MKLLPERARVLKAVRAFFDARGFLEVETPILVPSPGMDLHLEAIAAGDAWLGTSPEYQMKRLLADGWSTIFQITKAFRKGELGARHNPEFSILEWYRGGGGVADVMKDTEELVAAVTGGTVRVDGRAIDVTPPFARVTVCEAYARWAGAAPEETLRLAAEDEDTYFRLLVDRVEPALAALDHGVMLTEYPASQASLARKKPGDPRVAERFECYVAGVELCNGFGELTDPDEQRARFVADQDARRARGLPVYPIDEKLLAALAKIPAAGGNALGLDRLVALTCGTTEIARVLAFTAEEV
jgi:elongation factor P--(R)-beta-lysine ligase